MPTADAPTRERGHAGVTGKGYLATYLATVDQVVDLTWPTAVRVYDRMRRGDSKVASSLRAMFLPILGADWRINPRQASDEVTQALAEDLGLPVLDVEVAPPLRTRDRFDWGFHARHALLSRVFGFMPFELLGRYDAAGLWRLRKLAPRMPYTLTTKGLRIAPDGGLEGIEQQPPPLPAGNRRAGGRREPVFIPIEFLAVHVHEREGANWFGQSILRPVYRDWLLKDTYHRIAAIGIDRHGAGVPIYTDSPDGDQKEADAGQALAEGYRAGENAGGRIPHGAEFRLVGVEGKIPAILDYVRYHDEQIAGAALEMFSSLPSAPNGSRALGDSLIDFFELALNAHAADVATVDTNHVVEDWVDFNFGPSEPAPAIECAPIGADQELTAEALNQLIDAGAIVPDPALRRHLRRYYALPDQEGPDPAPTPAPAPPQPAAARAKVPAGTAAASVPDRPLWREPTATEAAAGVDFAAIDATFVDVLDGAVGEWSAVRATQIDQLVEVIVNLVEDQDLAGLASIGTDQTSGPGADLLSTWMADLADAASTEALAEAERQGVTIERTVVSAALEEAAERLTARAEAVDLLLARSLSEVAGRQALARTGGSLSGTEVADAVRAHLEGLSDTYLRDQLNGALTAAQNTGRKAVMAEAPARLFASELLDEATCEGCFDMDGTEFADLAAAEAAYPTGGFADCLGGPRCRGTLVAVYDEATSG